MHPAYPSSSVPIDTSDLRCMGVHCMYRNQKDVSAILKSDLCLDQFRTTNFQRLLVDFLKRAMKSGISNDFFGWNQTCDHPIALGNLYLFSLAKQLLQFAKSVSQIADRRLRHVILIASQMNKTLLHISR